MMLRLIIAIGLSVFCAGVMGGCASEGAPVDVSGGAGKSVVAGADYAKWMTPPTEVTGGVDAVIIPHHLLVKSFMEKFYAELAAATTIAARRESPAAKNSYTRVVIISPNHFGWGQNYIQTTDVINTTEKTIAKDAEAMLKGAPELDQEWISKLAEAKVAFVEPKLYSREHGVYTQYPFIKKYWPGAKVVPIIIKHGTPQRELDALVQTLDRLEDVDAGYTGGRDGKTLFLFSLDFTHYTGEEMAVKNDVRTMAWLGKVGKEDLSYQSAEDVGKSFDTSNADTVAVDSAESLYVLARLMKGSGDGWHLWARTSSASMIEGLNPLDNTSHIFGYFSHSQG